MNDSRCTITTSKKGWFTQDQSLMVLDEVHRHAGEKPSLLIWDDFPAHWTDKVVTRAKECNIQLLKVPSGLTPELQPLDFKVNGPYKEMMRQYYLDHHSFSPAEKSEVIHQRICDTCLTCYDRLSKRLIRKSFQCMLSNPNVTG